MGTQHVPLPWQCKHLTGSVSKCPCRACAHHQAPAHPVHGAEPIEALYVPEVHNVHVPPSGPAKTLLQRQELEVLLPTIELEFKGQSMHVFEFVAPVASAQTPLFGASSLRYLVAYLVLVAEWPLAHGDEPVRG